MDINKYTYQIFWSEEDQEYVATVAEFSSLSWLSTDRQKAENGLLDLVAEVIEDMAQSGEDTPTPLGVRTSPSLHRRLVMVAKTEGISLNTLINQKLASA